MTKMLVVFAEVLLGASARYLYASKVRCVGKLIDLISIVLGVAKVKK